MCCYRYVGYYYLIKRLISGLVFISLLVNAAYSEELQSGSWNNRYFKYNGQYPYFVGFDLQVLAGDSFVYLLYFCYGESI